MEFEIHPDDRGGCTVHLDGQPQSHLNPDDPEDLAFEYVAIAAAVIESVCAAHHRLRVTYVGGAGVTLPRWIQHRWVNLADEKNGRYVERVAAGGRESGLTHIAAWATSDGAKGRRFGNRIVLGSASPFDRDTVTRELRRLAWSTGAAPLRPARPFTAQDGEPSPAPPSLERTWRVR